MDIFDLNKLDDLDDSIKSQLSHKESSICHDIQSLFDIKPELNINEIVVGLYRQYNRDISRDQVRYAIYHLCNRKHVIKRTSRGIYGR